MCVITRSCKEDAVLEVDSVHFLGVYNAMHHPTLGAVSILDTLVRLHLVRPCLRPWHSVMHTLLASYSRVN